MAATPADCRPRTIAAPSRPTAAGSSPNERIPSAALPGSTGEVEDRGVHHVDAHRPGLAPDRRADPFGQVLVADRAERHVPRERGRRLAERHQLAGLLVGGDEQRPIHGAASLPRPRLARPLEPGREFADLTRIARR